MIPINRAISAAAGTIADSSMERNIPNSSWFVELEAEIGDVRAG
jgi:hypothetical protein